MSKAMNLHGFEKTTSTNYFPVCLQTAFEADPVGWSLREPVSTPGC